MSVKTVSIDLNITIAATQVQQFRQGLRPCFFHFGSVNSLCAFGEPDRMITSTPENMLETRRDASVL